MKKSILTIMFFVFGILVSYAQDTIVRPLNVCDSNFIVRIFQSGENNAITDVKGVSVGHLSLDDGGDMHTGVTAILPHLGNLYQKKTPAAIYLANGGVNLAGYPFVKEFGYIETPVILTNTLNVAEGIRSAVTYTLNQFGNENVKMVNSVVCGIPDGATNNVRARYVTDKHILEAIKNANSGVVEQGAVGAGSGAVSFGKKGGIGTSSRVLPESFGGYTIGVLVVANFDGAPQSSCTIIVATDAPLGAGQLERLAKRAYKGIAKKCNLSDVNREDCVIAFSVYKDNLINIDTRYYFPTLLQNKHLSPIFQAAEESVAEAVASSF